MLRSHRSCHVTVTDGKPGKVPWRHSQQEDMPWGNAPRLLYDWDGHNHSSLLSSPSIAISSFTFISVFDGLQINYLSCSCWWCVNWTTTTCCCCCVWSLTALGWSRPLLTTSSSSQVVVLNVIMTIGKKPRSVPVRKQLAFTFTFRFKAAVHLTWLAERDHRRNFGPSTTTADGRWWLGSDKIVLLQCLQFFLFS